MRLALAIGAFLAASGLVVWWVLGWAEADDIPVSLPAWAAVLDAWIGREAVAGVFVAGAAVFWMAALAVRAPGVATALVIGAVEAGLVWLAVAWGGQPGAFAAWLALVLAAMLIPWAPARKAGLAAVWFGGAAMGAASAAWTGGSAWCAAPVWLAAAALGVSVARAPRPAPAPAPAPATGGDDTASA